MTLLRLASALARLLTLLAIAGSLSSVAQGGETWDGGGGNNQWSTGANWNTVRGNESPPTHDGTADIIMAGTTKLSNQLDVDWDVNSLTFNNTAGAFSVNGFSGVTLGIGAGGMSNSDAQLQTLLLPIGLNGSQTWTAAAGPIILASGINSHPFLPRTLTLAGAFDVTVAGSITNNVTLSKTGDGTLFLVGADANTYGGNTSVTGGTLALNRTGGTDRAIPGNLTIGDGAGTDTVRLDAAHQITSAAGKLVTVNSSGVFNLNGFNETIRDLTINGGNVTTNGGTLTVAGSLSTTGGSVMTNGGALAVAGSLMATGGMLQLLNNASVTSGSGSIGDSAGSNGQVTVSGAGQVSVSGETFIGDDVGSMGELTIDGANASWNGAGRLYVGNAGVGKLNVTGAGHVNNLFSYIGNQTGAIGEVTVDGMGSTWTSDSLDVGYQGDGTLSITAGGQVSSTSATIGFRAGSSGMVTVDGSGSIWGSNFLNVGSGSASQGALNITNGGRVGVLITGAIGETGAVTVEGAGSVASFTDRLRVLDGGTLTVNSGATVSAKTISILGFVDVSGANLTLQNLGSPSLSFPIFSLSGSLQAANGAHVVIRNIPFNVDTTAQIDGTVTVDASLWESTNISVSIHGAFNVMNGGRVLNSAGIAIQPVWLEESASLVVDGSGSLWQNFRASPMYVRGLLTVSNGGEVKAYGGASIFVENTGTIRGNGTLTSDVQNSGVVSPGLSPGALHIDGNFSQTATGKLLIELASATSFDQLLVTNQAALDGTLTVNFLDGFTPAVGQSFTILTAEDIDGVFTTKLLPSVPGRIFDLIYNPQSVVLTVSPAFTADFDEDGDVDSDDFAQWQGDFGVNALSDADDDGDSDGADFLAWQRQFGSPAAATPNAVAVPEPGTFLLIIVASAGFRRSAGRKRQELVSA